jgi:hypothetical protein
LAAAHPDGDFALTKFDLPGDFVPARPTSLGCGRGRQGTVLVAHIPSEHPNPRGLSLSRRPGPPLVEPPPRRGDGVLLPTRPLHRPFPLGKIASLIGIEGVAIENSLSAPAFFQLGRGT